MKDVIPYILWGAWQGAILGVIGIEEFSVIWWFIVALGLATLTSIEYCFRK